MVTLLRSIRLGWSRSATPRTVEAPTTGPAADHLAVFVSGDGGWAKLDREVTAALAADFGARCAPVLAAAHPGRGGGGAGADRGPGDGETRAAADCGDRFLERRGGAAIYGAGVTPGPARADRAPGAAVAASAHRLRVPGARLDREGPSSLPVRPELEALRGLPLLLFRGAADRGSVCEEWPPGLGEMVTLPGGHHLAGAYRQIAAHILGRLRGAAELGPGAS